MRLFDKPSKYKNTDYRSLNYSGNWSRQFINDYYNNIDNIGIDQTNKQFENYKNEHLPKSLYKFCGPTAFNLSNINNNTVYLSEPKSFNDPFDCYLCSEKELYIKKYILNEIQLLNLISEKESKLKISKEEYGTLLSIKTNSKYSFSTIFTSIKVAKENSFYIALTRIEANANKDYQNKLNYLNSMEIGVSSFSSFKDEGELLKNTTMWSHYADHHRGFCIEYEVDFKIIDFQKEIKCGLFPITYTSRVPTLPIGELFKLDPTNEELTIGKQLMKSIFRTYTTKSAFWSYEKEWRLIFDLNQTHFQINRTIQFLKIKRIYLGCRIDHGVKKNITSIANGKNIEVIATKQSNEDFKLYTSLSDKNSIEKDEDNITYNNILEIKNIELRNKRIGQYFGLTIE